MRFGSLRIFTNTRSLILSRNVTFKTADGIRYQAHLPQKVEKTLIQTNVKNIVAYLGAASVVIFWPFYIFKSQKMYDSYPQGDYYLTPGAKDVDKEKVDPAIG